MRYFIPSITAFVLLFSLVTLPAHAQEATSTAQDGAMPEETAEPVMQQPANEALPDLVMDNVSIYATNSGYVVKWSTDRPSAGAVTYVTRDATNQELLQHRITNGQFQEQHQYVLQGLVEGATYDILLESVDQQMSYAREVLAIATPANHEPKMSSSGTLLYTTLFSLLAIAVLSLELWHVKRALLHKISNLENPKPKTRRTRKRSTTKAKKETKKSSTE